MTHRHRQRLLGFTAVPALGLLALGALAATPAPAPILINESPSLPEGLYRHRPDALIDRGAVVALRQPASARPWLARLGVPAEVRLIKRVAGVPGDLVCADGRMLLSAFHAVPVRSHDPAGAPLPRWTDCRRLGPDELLVLGDTAASFDSRYFGPVRRDQIDGVYQAVATW
jgi:conjugative transfer signal peptidase TraF